MNKNWAKNYPVREHLVVEKLDENSSLKKMLDFIEEDKQVIEFGCATGYFANLLINKRCVVTGVEINPDAAKVAEQYCKEVIVADLDLVSVEEILGSQKFDIAVFGDVLEHLRNPWKVLEETKLILKTDGYVVASIPNIAHGSIRLALLEGKFEYTNLGILDDTHLRFFTRQTTQKLFETSGYFIEEFDRTKMPVFSDSDIVPKLNENNFSKEIIQQIHLDRDIDTLQFIVKAFPLSQEVKHNRILKSKYQEALAELDLKKIQLQQTQTQLEQSQLQLQQTEQQKLQAEDTLNQIQNSIFWKLWKKLLKVRSRMEK